MEETSLFILILLVVLPVYYLVLQHRKLKFCSYPPGPYPLPIIGNILHLSSNDTAHVALANLAKIHGPIMSLKLGARLLIVGSSHEAATELLKIHDRVMCGRPVPKTLEVLGDNLLTLVGAKSCTENWKILRGIFKTELVASEVINSNATMREEKVKELIDLLMEKVGKVVHIRDLVFTTAANIVSRLLFSQDFIGIEDERKKINLVKEIVKLASTPNVADYFPIFSGLDVQGLRRNTLKCRESLYPLWDVIVDGRKESIKSGGDSCKNKDFLDVLLANGFSRNQINWILTEMILVSVDITSAAVEWMMAELIKNPEAMNKLGEELAKEIRGNIKLPLFSVSGNMLFHKAFLDDDYYHIRLKFCSYPPGPYPLPIIGNILQLSRKDTAHVALANLAKIHGPIMSLKLGARLLIVGSSHEVATEILKIHDRVMCGRPVPQTLEVLGGDLLTLIGAKYCTENWKILRGIFKTELVASEVMNSNTTMREEKVKELIDLFMEKEGKVVHINDVVYTTVTNILSRLFFLKDFIGIEDERKKINLIQEVVKLGSALNVADYFPIFSGLDVQGLRRKALKCCGNLYPLWEVFVDGRKESIKSGDSCKDKDFVGVLLSNGFSRNQINWILTEVTISGVDTTSAAVEWMMAELIKNPEAMNKLCEELAKEISGNIVRDSDLPRLPYLNACVKESLRLHPTVALVLRTATETCEVMNYTIPKDSEVWVNLWALGRDPTKWDDPFTFNPNRFLGSNLSYMGNNFEYIPFGSGKRMCPGLPLATRTVPLIVASLVHSFEWYLPDDTTPADLDMDEKLGVTLQKANPLLLIPKSKALEIRI
ncbi:Cytochrome p450 [Thalictrum thalictroides]|uniref:Cytochrome p450 n=1 Tax=Thalictrum thalictroides TaxID=46969 RepID=A0A7J6WZI8_THATH|nr:Cytochrome p450 [Thalictrum thalictroides]